MCTSRAIPKSYLTFVDGDTIIDGKKNYRLCSDSLSLSLH